MKVAFTGHRPPAIGYCYDRPNPLIVVATRNVLDELVRKEEIEEAYCGMALGFDQTAATVCLEQGVPVVACIPCIGHEKKWPEHSQRRYRGLLDRIVTEGGRIEQARVSYSPDAMMARNRFMVDRADLLIACWNGEAGGTGNCVRYAQHVGKAIISIWHEDFRRRVI